MKKFVLIICYISLSFFSQGQVKSYVINSQGGNSQYAGGNLAYSVGEPVIGTSSGTSVTITQGFLQTWQTIVRQIALKIFIEGLYSGGGMMHETLEFDPISESFTFKWGSGIADKVNVELYDDTYTFVARYLEVNLNTNGLLTIPTVNASISDSYYITISHRNSMPITTAFPVSFAGTTINYDFTTPADQAYGVQSQKALFDGFYGMYTGELDHDTWYFIDGDDNTIMEPAVILSDIGYLLEDLDGSGYVDGDDNVIMEPNVIISPYFQNPLTAKKHSPKFLNK